MVSIVRTSIYLLKHNLIMFTQMHQFTGGWPGAPNAGQFRGQYPPQSGPQGWQQGPGVPRPGQGPPQGPQQWEQNRYPMNSQFGPVS